MMRTMLFSLVLFPAICAAAQPGQPAPPEGSNWQHVQALRMGASINVKTSSSHTNCKLKSVDAETLTCTQGRDITFERSEILTIRIPHGSRSALIGAALGGGVGAIIGAATDRSSCSAQEQKSLLGCLHIFSRGQVAALAGAAGAAIGVPVGYFTDFAHSTVYKAP